MALITVSFYGTDTGNMFGGPEDILQTDHLMNCIAIVAFDRSGQGAVMQHYDTLHANKGFKLDRISGEEASKFSKTRLKKLRREMEATLRLHVSNADIEFKIAIGALWMNIEPQTTTWKSRFNLITAVVAAFGVEPETGGTTATFSVETSDWTNWVNP